MASKETRTGHSRQQIAFETQRLLVYHFPVRIVVQFTNRLHLTDCIMMELRLIACTAIVSVALGFAPTQPAITRMSALSAEADPIASTADAIIGKVSSRFISLYRYKVSHAFSLQFQYKAGNANTDFSKRFGHLADAKVKTVGEAFADFTTEYGTPVNPLYKNMITDIVGTTHLTLVNCRFARDPIWSLGLLTTLDLLLKNYPEPENATRLVSSFMKSVGLDEAAIRAEAAEMEAWAKSVSRADVEAALSGEGSSTLATVSNKAREDKFWMYSRYFGIGLLKIMECTGVEMEKDEAYPIMEDWMQNKFGRSAMTACVSNGPNDEKTQCPYASLINRLIPICTSRFEKSWI